MTERFPLLHLHDLDLLLAEARDPDLVARLRRVGLPIGAPQAVEKARERQIERLDPRWRHHYQRAFRRYGAGLATVRGRVCQGCFMTLPRSATPGESEALTLCESCGRILYWGRSGPG